jgi:hypothetical protein
MMMSKKQQSRLEPRNLALAADLEFEGAWRVEYFDSDGACHAAGADADSGVGITTVPVAIIAIPPELNIDLGHLHVIRYAPRARVRALWGLSGWRGNERIGKL